MKEKILHVYLPMPSFSEIKIKTLLVGPLQTNCYIISSKKEGAVIDPGGDEMRILKELEGLDVKYIILTHVHFDHIIACKKIKINTGAKILCHKEERKILKLFHQTRSLPLQENDIDIFIKEKDNIEFGNIFLKVIHTPGHTPGSICLYNSKVNIKINHNSSLLFSGDTIFAGSIGATCWPGGDFEMIKKSIEKKLLILPDDTLVCPGHGSSFRLGDEKGAIKEMLKN